jgi:RNA polymerase sigma factor (TIGR02999 family)
MTSPAPLDRPSPERLTLLLHAAQGGDQAAIESLFATVYAELRTLAARQLGHERPGHTLQATALVHEAFLKLMQQETAGVRTPAEFLGVAALAMRRILVDHARKRGRHKRGGGIAVERTLLDGLADQWGERAIDLVALDEALARLAARDVQKARLVELRFFAGLSMQEAADAIGLPLRTVEREWTAARAFLRSELDEDLT